MSDAKAKIIAAAKLMMVEGRDVCTHGLAGPCVQCDPWCPRDPTPEWLAYLQALYERAATPKPSP